MFLYVSGSAICKFGAWQFRYLFVSLEVLEFPRTLIVGLLIAESGWTLSLGGVDVFVCVCGVCVCVCVCVCVFTFGFFFQVAS